MCNDYLLSKTRCQRYYHDKLLRSFNVQNIAFPQSKGRPKYSLLILSQLVSTLCFIFARITNSEIVCQGNCPYRRRTDNRWLHRVRLKSRSHVCLWDVRGCDVLTERLTNTTGVICNQVTVDAVVPIRSATPTRHRNTWKCIKIIR